MQDSISVEASGGRDARFLSYVCPQTSRFNRRRRIHWINVSTAANFIFASTFFNNEFVTNCNTDR